MNPSKATITVKRKNNKEEQIKVCFNPTQYSLDGSNQIAEIGVPGLNAPILQYVRGNTRTLSMELFFDTYEEGKDVEEAYVKKIFGLLDIDPDTHAPPVCVFEWKKECRFTCVLERVSGTYNLFLADGTPVRATLRVTFKEYKEINTLVREPLTKSADHAQVYTVKQSDTLSAVAAAFYGDPGQWRPIARANRISNPRLLVPGQVLRIPPLS